MKCSFLVFLIINIQYIVLNVSLGYTFKKWYLNNLSQVIKLIIVTNGNFNLCIRANPTFVNSNSVIILLVTAYDTDFNRKNVISDT